MAASASPVPSLALWHKSSRANRGRRGKRAMASTNSTLSTRSAPPSPSSSHRYDRPWRRMPWATKMSNSGPSRRAVTSASRVAPGPWPEATTTVDTSPSAVWARASSVGTSTGGQIVADELGGRGAGHGNEGREVGPWAELERRHVGAVEVAREEDPLRARQGIGVIGCVDGLPA